MRNCKIPFQNVPHLNKFLGKLHCNGGCEFGLIIFDGFLSGIPIFLQTVLQSIIYICLKLWLTVWMGTLYPVGLIWILQKGEITCNCVILSSSSTCNYIFSVLYFFSLCILFFTITML